MPPDFMKVGENIFLKKSSNKKYGSGKIFEKTEREREREASTIHIGIAK